MKTALFLIFYNNKEEIQRLLNSVPDKVIDYLIAVDGPFRYNLDMNPNLSHKSDDGSLKIIYDSAPKFNNSVMVHHKPGATEFDKRNAYLEDCEKLGDVDVGIIIDSDEYFVYPSSTTGGLKPIDCWTRFKQNIEIDMIQNRHQNVYGIRYLEDTKPGGGEGWKTAIDTSADTYKPRIWVDPGQMRYISNSHYNYANIKTELETVEYFKKYKQVYCQSAAKVLRGGVVLTQDQSLRTEKYQQQRKQYQQYLVSYEPMVQQGKSHEEADSLAKDNPAENWNPI